MLMVSLFSTQTSHELRQSRDSTIILLAIAIKFIITHLLPAGLNAMEFIANHFVTEVCECQLKRVKASITEMVRARDGSEQPSCYSQFGHQFHHLYALVLAQAQYQQQQMP